MLAVFIFGGHFRVSLVFDLFMLLVSNLKGGMCLRCFVVFWGIKCCELKLLWFS